MRPGVSLPLSEALGPHLSAPWATTRRVPALALAGRRALLRSASVTAGQPVRPKTTQPEPGTALIAPSRFRPNRKLPSLAPSPFPRVRRRLFLAPPRSPDCAGACPSTLLRSPDYAGACSSTLLRSPECAGACSSTLLRSPECAYGCLPASGGSVWWRAAGVVFNFWFPANRTSLVSDRSRFRPSRRSPGCFQFLTRQNRGSLLTDPFGTPRNRACLPSSLFPLPENPELKTTSLRGTAANRSCLSSGLFPLPENPELKTTSARADHPVVVLRGAVVRCRGGAGPMHPRRHYRSAPPDTGLPREPGESVGAGGFEGGRLRED
jgi:hypothetical protein